MSEKKRAGVSSWYRSWVVQVVTLMFRSTRLSNTSAKTVGSVNGSVNPLFQPYPIDSNGLYGVIGGEGGIRTHG